MQLSQPSLEHHSLCYTCWVQVVYSLLPTLLFSSCSLWGHPNTAQFRATRRSSPGVTRSMRTSRRLSPSRRPCGALLLRASRICFMLPLYQTFVINVINNIRTRFNIYFYMICAMIYCSYTCDLILARIWLFGLCPFINRVLHATNNQAEYRAVLKGIQLLREIKADAVEIFGDSMLVIN